MQCPSHEPNKSWSHPCFTISPSASLCQTTRVSESTRRKYKRHSFCYTFNYPCMQNIFFSTVHPSSLQRPICLKKHVTFMRHVRHHFGLHSLKRCYPGECHFGVETDLQAKANAHIHHTHLFLRTNTLLYSFKENYRFNTSNAIAKEFNFF